MNVKCLITGINLREVASGTCQRGDLFSIGNCYIVNANSYIMEEAAYDESIPTLFYMADSRDYFERRDVFIFQQSEVTLNEAAKQYIAGTKK